MRAIGGRPTANTASERTNLMRRETLHCRAPYQSPETRAPPGERGQQQPGGRFGAVVLGERHRDQVHRAEHPAHRQEDARTAGRPPGW